MYQQPESDKPWIGFQLQFRRANNQIDHDTSGEWTSIYFKYVHNTFDIVHGKVEPWEDKVVWSSTDSSVMGLAAARLLYKIILRLKPEHDIEVGGRPASIDLIDASTSDIYATLTDFSHVISVSCYFYNHNFLFREPEDDFHALYGGEDCKRAGSHDDWWYR